MLCGWEAMKKVGPKGKVVGVVRNPKQVPGLLELGVYTDVIVADCTKPVEVMEAALAANDGKEYDLSICCVNIESCEMSAILPSVMTAWCTSSPWLPPSPRLLWALRVSARMSP